MALMTVDHASDVFNHDQVKQDAFAWGANGASLYKVEGEVWHFLTRWITHLCAPTFVFLAGAAIALSVHARVARAEDSRAIDRHLWTRGALLVALEFWMGLGFTMFVLGVLFAIGVSMIALSFLRRLPIGVLLVGALGWLVGYEWVTEVLGLRPAWPPTEGFPFPHAGGWAHLTFVHGFVDLPFDVWGPDAFKGELLIMYPVLSWLPVMVLGWVFGTWLAQIPREGREQRAAKMLLICGGAALGVFVLQRLGNGYGNFWITRTDDDLLRWLQVSKYPASLAFHALELGIMALCLAGMFRLSIRVPVRENTPLLVWGQCALFYYLVHLHLLDVVLLALGKGPVSLGQGPFGLWSAWTFAALVLTLLYPACRWYRGVKARHPRSLLRYF